MSVFESLLVLLVVAIGLLQVARRLSMPYPAMLAAAGVALAFVPGAPTIALDPRTALPLFIAPVLVDAGFDFPLGAIRRLWRPLFSLVVVAVALSAGAVACVGVAMAGLPIYAALALGAIVAPPDAAAATALLGTVSMPRNSVIVLKGESLLNDASALLLFAFATQVQTHGGVDGALALRLAIAAPGGVLLGILLARLFRTVTPAVTGTLGGNLLEFVGSFSVWIIAERLELSPVLCLVAFAMTLARRAGMSTPPRMRIHSYAVWNTVVFLLNVLAFLLMGFQARTIVHGMAPGGLRDAALFAGAVVLCLIVVRMGWVLTYNLLAKRVGILGSKAAAPSLRHGVLVGWCGMRGLVTVATALALPLSFPQRDLIVLTAFAVVLATLVAQGLTLPHLVRLLKLDGEDGLGAELNRARVDLAATGLEAIAHKKGVAADHWRYAFETARDAAADPPRTAAFDAKRRLGLLALRRQRLRLDQMNHDQVIGPDAYLVLQEELDFNEVVLSDEDQRHIEES